MHLKRLASPKSWPIKRKTETWVVNLATGPHTRGNKLPLGLIIRDLLGFAKTANETKKILNKGKVLINKKVRKDSKFPVGLMDIVEIPEINKIYLLLLNDKGKFIIREIKKANLKPFKITGKKYISKNKTQLQLYDGTTLLVDKNDYKPGDTLILELPKKTIKEHLKLNKGSLIYLTSGKYRGKYGTLDKIIKFGQAKDKIVFNMKDKSEETLKDFAFVVTKDFVFENESNERNKDR